MGTFRAYCAKGHLERLDFSDGKALEQHMRQEHGAKPLTVGGPYMAKDRHGHWKRYPKAVLRPGDKPYAWTAPRAPKDEGKLSETLAEWADWSEFLADAS